MDVCRCCLSYSNVSVDIFSKSMQAFENKSFADLLNEVLSDRTRIELHDDLPKKICKDCIKVLYQSVSFRKQCEEAYLTLVVRNKSVNDPKGQGTDLQLVENSARCTEKGGPQTAPIFREVCPILPPNGSEPSEVIIKQEDTCFSSYNGHDDTEFVSIDDQAAFSEISLCKIESENIEVPFSEKIKYTPITCNEANSINVVKKGNEVFSEKNPISESTDPLCKDHLQLAAQKKASASSLNKVTDKPSHTCNFCCQSFASREQLQNHLTSKADDKPFLCPQCGVRCKAKRSLEIHLRRHNGEKPFKCKFCSKAFTSQSETHIHEKYHTAQKSHFCEKCGKGFIRLSCLKIHSRVHTGERPYVCHFCPQAFKQSNDLKTHIKRHTGERFQCEICNAKFLQIYQVRQHKLSEHGIQETAPIQRVKKFISLEEQQTHVNNVKNLGKNEQHNKQKKLKHVTKLS